MGRKKGSKNKVTLERESEERAQERAFLGTERAQRLADDATSSVDDIDTRLGELDALDAGTGTEPPASGDDGDDRDDSMPDASLDKDRVDSMLDAPLSEAERAASASTAGSDGLGFVDPSGAPPVSDQGIPPVEPTGDASNDLKPEVPTRGRPRKRADEPRPAETRLTVSVDRAAMMRKRERAALTLGRAVDRGLDKMAEWAKSPIRTKHIQSGALFPPGPDGNPAPQGVPYDLSFGGEDFLESRTTFLTAKGEIIFATPGMAIAFGLAGQGNKLLQGAEEFFVKHEETIRIVAACATFLGWAFVCYKSGQAYAKEMAAQHAAPAPVPSPIP